MEPVNDAIRILSIDGGGIRGLIPARVLAYVEEKTGQPVAALFDMIVGTSTGGLLTLGLTRPRRRGSSTPEHTAKDIAQIYHEEGPAIFSRSRWRSITTANAFLGVKYPDRELNRVLKKYLGASYLQDALTEIMVTAYELEGRSAFFFKRRLARKDSSHNFPMWKAARATAAAPTYFSPFLIEDDDRRLSLIDGGVFANNPAMCAYAEARRIHPPGTPLLVVSLGTGDHTEPIRHSSARNWGQAQWAQPILDVVFHGASDTVDYQMRHALSQDRGEYYRFTTRLSQASDKFDDASDKNLAALDQLADRLIREREQELDELCERLVTTQ